MASKEKKGFGQWLSAHATNQEDGVALKKLWEATGTYKDGYEPDMDNGWASMQKRMGQPAKVVRLNPVPKLMRIAAAALILLAAGFALKNFLFTPGESETIVAAPGTSTDISLLDGTKVTLNQNGSLTYPNNFNGTERRVHLEGEAFFEVAHNPSVPFILETAQIEVKVLGTSFNVRSFPSEQSVQVFVKTGMVEVKIKSTGKAYKLAPGEVLTLPANAKEALISAAENDNLAGWKEGRLSFRETPLYVILENVQQQFGITFNADKLAAYNCPFTISVERDHMDEAFKALETSCPLRFEKLDSETVRITGTCCE